MQELAIALPRPIDEQLRFVALRHESLIEAERVLGQHRGKFVHLLAGQARAHSLRQPKEDVIPNTGRDRGNRAPQSRSHGPRQKPRRLWPARGLGRIVVAGEHLVSPIARQSDRHVAPRHLRDQKSRDLR